MTNYSFTKVDVPAAAGTYQYISVDGVDAAGEAVGNYGSVDGDGDGTFHGLTATGSNGTTSDPPGSSNTDIVGITSGGEIFGDYVDFENRQHGFVESNGVVTTIDIFLANSTTVSGLTNAGMIYGTYVDAANGIHGFTDNNGVIAQIDVPGAKTTSIAGINAAGTIVGTYTDASDVAHGFIDKNGGFQSFDPSGSISTSVVGASGAGKIAGNYQDSANNAHAFVDNNGVITNITIPGATSVGAEAINAAGEIVGYYIDSASNVHGFVDNDGVITKVDVPGATETDIQAISASGVISGYYNDSGGHQHGFVGTLPTTVISTDGSTRLVRVGDNYFLDSKSTGAGPEVIFGGAPLVAGQSPWVPIGAVQTSSGYQIALKDAAIGQYTLWNTDADGNVTYDPLGGGVSGSSPVLETIERNFQQDLNGDGVIGIPGAIESSGSASLVQVGNHDFLDSNSTGTGPEVMFGGAPLAVGQSPWTPIAAEQTSSGYEIALKEAAIGQYTVWNVDTKGNVTYDPLGGGVSPTSFALESLEPSFHQDLNGDGVIGVLIGSSVSTNLVRVGDNYFLDSKSTGAGPEVIFGGAPLVAGQSPWVPIGAVQTSSGYQIALKDAAIGQYTLWNTDASGNVTYDPLGNVPGSTPVLETTELSFQQDLNGDGVIGIPGAIESSGSTSLVQVGNHDFLDSNSTGTGPELMYGGAPLAVGQSPWTPIAAEQMASGYKIALKDAATGQYTEWYTDSSGNVTYDPLGGSVSPTSFALESMEPNFHQDLNGDGVIGQVVPAGGSFEVPTFGLGPVEFLGSTGTLTLDISSVFQGQVLNFTGNGNLATSDHIDLRDVQFGSGTTASFVGTSSGGTLTVSDTHFDTAHISLVGDYTNSTFSLYSDGSGGTIVIDPPAKQDTADGTLSFDDPNPTDTHSVSVSPQEGAAGYLGSFVADAVNTTNNQDTVEWHFNFGASSVAQTVTQSYEVGVTDHHADGTTSTSAQSVTVTIAGPGHDAFVFHPGLGADTIVNAASTDTFELDGFSSVSSNTELASLLRDAQTGQPQSVFQTVNGGHDTLIELGNHDSITLTKIHIADLHASDFIIH